MTEAFTLGVVGHVDHGKTALVRALTNMETDRLREEQQRGLSIALGFAYIETSNGSIDLIDVPGHEDFVRTMIGGATGLDGVVLCIAANEGVMPQTVEHLNIARLLGLANGIVVITKADLVTPEVLAETRASARDLVRGTFLENAPLLDVSTVSGHGIEAVRRAIGDCRLGPGRSEPGGGFFLPLDRAFTMRGFGVVVTGTLRGGGLAVGDAVELMPSRNHATVRGLQNHNRPIEQAFPGQRVAVNLRGIERADVRRGEVLAAPGSILAVSRVDACVEQLETTRPLRNGVTVRFLTGTCEAMAKLRLLDRQTLEPGESAFVQLTLDREIATRPQEPCLIRTVSPMHTIGGGMVIAVNPGRHRRYDTRAIEWLKTLASRDFERILGARLKEFGARGLKLDTLARELAINSDELREIAVRTGVVFVVEDLVLSERVLEQLSTAILEAVERFHAANPLQAGLELASLVRDWIAQWQADPAIVRLALKRLEAAGALDLRGQTISRHGYDAFARLPENERQLVAAMEEAFRGRGIEATSPDAVVGSSPKRQVILRLLLEAGRIVRLRTYDRATQLVVHADCLHQAVSAIEREFPYPSAFAAREVRDLLGSTRKYVVPLMEHLDASGVTVRNGDMRRLRQHDPEEGGHAAE